MLAMAGALRATLSANQTAGIALVGAVLLAGLLLLALPISRLKLAGIPLLGLAFMLAANASRPDVYVDAEADAVAVRGADGKLTIHGANRDRLAALAWLAADADGRTVRDNLGGGFTCDTNGCIARLADGSIVAVVLRPEAFADDCRDAALVVTRFELPERCAAAGIDRRLRATTGSIALRRIDGKWVAETARSPFADRPWYGRAAPADAKALERLAPRLPAAPAPAIEERPLRPGDVPVPDVPEGEVLDE
jgi:competence protein ComEC